MNFGYTQVLFMGSVPRINCLPNIKIKNKRNKGVSTTSKQLPYTLIVILFLT